jgi:uncharacterized protein
VGDAPGSSKASPFCNINCDYCYLPNRTSTRRMSMQVLASAIEKTYASDLVRGELTIIWHAGEPLAVPISWYEEALATISVTAPTEANIVHSIQSNGTLLNQRWCDFIKSHDIRVGLSIDGPDFLHDLHRKTRRGDGSHRAAMRALQLLKDNDIPFHVIAVITSEALGHAQEIYDFFETAGVERLGFNIEEVEAEHAVSTLGARHEERVRQFYQTIFENQKRRGSITIPEFAAAEQKIRSGISLREFDFPWLNEQVRPFGIVSVDSEGIFPLTLRSFLGCRSSPTVSSALGTSSATTSRMRWKLPTFVKRSRISRLGSNDAPRLARTTATAARALRLTSSTRTAPSRPHKPSIVAMRCKCRSI